MATFSTHTERWGLLGLVLAIGAIGILGVLGVAPFRPRDEPAHYGYAVSIAEGRLPTIDTPVPVGDVDSLAAEMERRDPSRRTIWTANHPPLWYVIAAVPAKVGRRLGAEESALRAMRMLNLLFGIVLVLATYRLARLLLPDRPRFHLVSAAVVGLNPMAMSLTYAAYNDVLAAAAGSIAMVAAVQWLKQGPTRKVGVVAVACSAAAVGTRVSGLVVALPVAAALFVGALSHAHHLSIAEGPDPASSMRRRARVARALRWPLVLVASIAASSGWFWIRNFALYRSVTGSAYLMNRFGRVPGDSVVRQLASPHGWVLQVVRLWKEAHWGVYQARWFVDNAPWLSLVPLVGLALLAVRAVRSWVGRGGTDRDPQRWYTTWRAHGWVLCGATFFLSELSMVRHVAEGGLMHVRYLLAGLPFLSMVVALGLTEGLRASRGVVEAAMVCAAAVLNVAYLDHFGFLGSESGVHPGPWWRWAPPSSMALLAVAVVGLVMFSSSLLISANRSRVVPGTSTVSTPRCERR